MRVPSRCPSCAGPLRVRELRCPDCDTRVEGSFDPCSVCALPDEDRALLELYLKARGNAKGVERELGISYPTVRARLEQLWQHLDAARERHSRAEASHSDAAGERSAVEIVQELEDGRLTVAQTAALLRTRGAGSIPGTGVGNR